MPLNATIGIAPIAWWNDDLEELSDDVSLEECMRQAAAAGFTGMETGRRFPMRHDDLAPLLEQFGMSVCGGWFSGLLLDGDVETEKQRVREQLDLFLDAEAPCLVYGETARSIQGNRAAPLANKPALSADEMRDYGKRVSGFAAWLRGEGMPLAYHHHMGAVVQTEEEIDALMAVTSEEVGLVFDTGHLVMAGADPLGVLERHADRIIHVHAKDVRRSVLDGIDPARDSFLDAVLKGVFTVPGDGDLDFGEIAECLHGRMHEGWFVVEAEQDPVSAPPAKMAQIGHAALRAALTEAGYNII